MLLRVEARFCAADIGSDASSELWRHGELRGYHTRLESEVSALLSEKGIPHESDNLFGAVQSVPEELLSQPQLDPFIPHSLSEGILFDAIEIFRGSGNWSGSLEKAGLRVHDGFDIAGDRVRTCDVADPRVVRELLALALRKVVREWHAGVPCVSFGTLRRPRVRSRAQPAGFDPLEPFTAHHNMLARRTAFVLTVAVLHGQWVSVEQPAGTSLCHLHCFRLLAQLGCLVTTFCFCSYGSPFLKRSRWLHNKPWLCKLASKCTCGHSGAHFEVRGPFTPERLSEFRKLCKPDVRRVYGVEPLLGQSVAAYSGAYPLGLTSRMASGSLAAASGVVPRVPVAARLETARFLGLDPNTLSPLPASDSRPYPARAWHEDPQWISELCQSLQFRELFRYRFAKPGHINVNEARVFKSRVKSVARRSSNVRAAALLDSRVTIGAAAKGRSSSFAISRVLQGSLGYILGSGIYYSLLHCYSEDNVADDPSRDRAVAAPRKAIPLWLEELLKGRTQRFEAVVASARIARNPARWLRFLLLLAGDIERNPGPARARRGALDLEAGFAPSTAHKMRKSLAAFLAWLRDEAELDPAAVLASADTTALALCAFGLHLYEGGLPRYIFVYAITAIQDKFPQHRNFLTAAWQIDKKWQRAEPGSCRAVLPAAAVRAAVSVALLWGWFKWAGAVITGFLAMLHPGELVELTRRDLVFPEDTLGHTSSLFVHLRNPKTSRFARRQHGRIDDQAAIQFLFSLVRGLPPGARLYPGSTHSFRKQWNAILDRLGLPSKAAEHEATPGVLRGSGATHFYIATENIPLLAWRGRWARTKTLEYYLQEVAAQVLLAELKPAARARIRALDQAADELLAYFSGASQ